MKNLQNLTAVLSYINKHPLAGTHKVVAYSKFITWQLTQLLFPDEKKVAFVDQISLLVSKGIRR